MIFLIWTLFLWELDWGSYNNLIMKNEQVVESFSHARLCWSLTKNLIVFQSIMIHLSYPLGTDFVAASVVKKHHLRRWKVFSLHGRERMLPRQFLAVRLWATYIGYNIYYEIHFSVTVCQDWYFGFALPHLVILYEIYILSLLVSEWIILKA